MALDTYTIVHYDSTAHAAALATFIGAGAVDIGSGIVDIASDYYATGVLDAGSNRIEYGLLSTTGSAIAGIINDLGVSQATGIYDGTTISDYGILDGNGVYHPTGIFDGVTGSAPWGYHDWGILQNDGSYYPHGVFDGAVQNEFGILWDNVGTPTYAASGITGGGYWQQYGIYAASGLAGEGGYSNGILDSNNAYWASGAVSGGTFYPDAAIVFGDLATNPTIWTGGTTPATSGIVDNNSIYHTNGILDSNSWYSPYGILASDGSGGPGAYMDTFGILLPEGGGLPGTYAPYGILDPTGVFYATGILHEYEPGLYDHEPYGILDTSGVWHATGVSDGNGVYFAWSGAGIYQYDQFLPIVYYYESGVFSLAANQYQQYGAHGLFLGNPTITNMGIVDANGTLYGYGILDSANNYYTYGILASSGFANSGLYQGPYGILLPDPGDGNPSPFYYAGILDDSNVYHDSGTLCFENPPGESIWRQYGIIYDGAGNPGYQAAGIMDSDSNYRVYGILKEVTPGSYTSGLFAGFTGILDSGGNYYEYGILDRDTTYHEFGILDAYGPYGEPGYWQGYYGLLDLYNNYRTHGILSESSPGSGYTGYWQGYQGILDSVNNYYTYGILPNNGSGDPGVWQSYSGILGTQSYGGAADFHYHGILDSADGYYAWGILASNYEVPGLWQGYTGVLQQDQYTGNGTPYYSLTDPLSSPYLLGYGDAPDPEILGAGLL